MMEKTPHLWCHKCCEEKQFIHGSVGSLAPVGTEGNQARIGQEGQPCLSETIRFSLSGARQPRSCRPGLHTRQRQYCPELWPNHCSQPWPYAKEKRRRIQKQGQGWGGEEADEVRKGAEKQAGLFEGGRGSGQARATVSTSGAFPSIVRTTLKYRIDTTVIRLLNM